MAVRVVRLTNSGRRTKVTPDYNDDGSIGMSRLIYQKLGSLTLNRTILADYEAGKLPKEYVEFLDRCNEILYNDTWGPTFTITDAMTDLDAYLSTLGVTAEYQYSKDTLDVKEWITAGETTEYRYLAEYPQPVENSIRMSTGEDHFVLMDGDETLVVYQ